MPNVTYATTHLCLLANLREVKEIDGKLMDGNRRVEYNRLTFFCDLKTIEAIKLCFCKV